MQVLKEIRDDASQDASCPKKREAARAILFDENQLIPLLFVAKYGYHKLPGGGIDDDENQLEALRRECLEEAGVAIVIDGEVGEIIEFRSESNLKQKSYCYFGKVISKTTPSFTAKEVGNGFELKWVSLADAIAKLENDNPEDYEGKFIRERDLTFLKIFHAKQFSSESDRINQSI